MRGFGQGNGRGRRRRFVLWLALILVIAVLGAACSSDDSGSTDDAAADIDPNGTYLFPLSLAAQGGVAFDPIQGFTATDMPFHVALYDTLLRRRPTGEVVPGLAESATAIDPSTIEVKLRPNLKFSDDTPLDAAGRASPSCASATGPAGRGRSRPRCCSCRTSRS